MDEPISMQPLLSGAILAAMRQNSIKEMHFIDGTSAPVGAQIKVQNDYVSIYANKEEYLYPLSAILKVKV